MKLDEAYQAWGSQSDNRELYNKTKDMVRKAIWTLPANKPCEYYKPARGQVPGRGAVARKR